MLPPQQHGWLWEDRDIGGQRQSGDGEHQAGVLRAAASPGERRLWKGTCGSGEWALNTLDHIPSIMWSAELFRLLIPSTVKDYFEIFWLFSLPCRFSRSRKSSAQQRAKYLPWKFWKRYIFFYISPFVKTETQSCFYHFSLEWCTAALSLYPVDIMIARLFLQTNIMVPLVCKYWLSLKPAVG